MADVLALKGSTSTHGGLIIEGSAVVDVNGVPVARIGDRLQCPIHGLQPLISGGSTVVFVDGKAAAKKGSVAQCGAIITTGADGVLLYG
jgi:uncharacterized Zn-binding protein involved in type VI secretion